MFEDNKIIQYLWLAALLIFPILLWLLPGDFFDYGDTVLCPSRLLFDIECFGCGMTRAIMHAHHFEFDDAVYYNTGSLLVYPGLIFVWCLWVYRAYKRIKSLNNAQIDSTSTS